MPKINTKQELKIALKKYVASKDEPFETREAADDFQQLSGKIRISPNKMSNFIRGTGIAEFDPKIKKWINKTSLKINKD